jgi:hypothetical protein
MGLHTGQTNNIYGRPKGSLNKSTDELRQTVQSFIENNIDSMQSNFDLLEPKEKLLFIEKILCYTLPKMQAVQMNAEINDLQEETRAALKAFRDSIK